MANNKKWFYGIYGIEFIYHGEWADPELIWHKKSFNYFDVETPLYETYREECNNAGIIPNDNNFDIWVKRNAHIAREYLQNLHENKCFYGGQ